MIHLRTLCSSARTVGQGANKVLGPGCCTPNINLAQSASCSYPWVYIIFLRPMKNQPGSLRIARNPAVNAPFAPLQCETCLSRFRQASFSGATAVFWVASWVTASRSWIAPLPLGSLTRRRLFDFPFSSAIGTSSSPGRVLGMSVLIPYLQPL